MEREVHGEWWLPEAPDKRVAGTLTFSREQGGRLLVLGSLRSLFDAGETTHEDGVTTVTMTEASLERSAVYPMIHGDSGAAYTLIDCLVTQSQSGIFGGAAHEALHVSQIFKGVLYQPDAPPDADALTVRMKHTAHWTVKSGLTSSVVWAENGEDDLPEGQPRFTQQAHDVSNEDVTLPDGTVVTLWQSLQLGGDRVTTATLGQDFGWRVKAEQVKPIDELLDVAGELQALVSMSTDRTAEFEALTLWHPDAVRKVDDEKQFPVPVEMFARWNATDDRSSRPPTHESDMLFTLPMLGGMQGVGRWLEVAERHRGAVARVMGSRYAEAMFVSDRLLNRAAALEAFDRDRTSYGNSKLKTRLKRNATLAGDPFNRLVTDIDAWAEKIRYHRNDVAHHLGSGRESVQIWTLAESLYWLFVMCMLRQAAIPDAAFEHMVQHQTYRHLQRRLPAAIT